MKVIRMRSTILLLVLELFSVTLFAQLKEVKVNDLKAGDIFPNTELNDIQYFMKKDISTDDLKGKWTVLYFWSSFCHSCIASFPKLDSLQRKFNKDIQIILIGVPYKDGNETLPIYERARKTKKLGLPILYSRALNNAFKVSSYPGIFIIDPNGIFKGKTYTLDQELLLGFISGKSPKLKIPFSESSELSKSYNREVPLLVDNNGGDDNLTIKRSLITKWDDKMPKYTNLYDRSKFECIGYDLIRMFRLAYFGSDYWLSSDTAFYGKTFLDPIINVKNKSYLDLDSLFSYSLCIDRHLQDSLNLENGIRGNQNLQKIFQRDLGEVFPYKVSVEIKKRPIYKLVFVKNSVSKLKTKGDSPKTIFIGEKLGVKLINRNVGFIINALNSSFDRINIPIFDDTGILEYLDIDIEGMYFQERLKSLRKNGFDLVKDEREMRVLIIEDK